MTGQLHKRVPTRNGRSAMAAMRAGMPADVQAAAVTADRLREQRRCLDKTAHILQAGGVFVLYVCGPGLAGVDMTAAPALRQVRGRRLQARADAGATVALSVDDERARLLAQFDVLAAKVAVLREKYR